MSNASQVVAVLKRTKAKYVESAKTDIITALNFFHDLSPDAENFTFPDGTRNLTFRLKGTIPVLYKGTTYNIPVALYLWDTHPYYAPICYVCPTPNMMVKESKTVDKQGRIYLPYLTDWRHPGYDLIGLLQVMALTFRESCPVFAKPSNSTQRLASAGGSSTPQSQPAYTPYPTSVSAGMPPYPMSSPQTGQYPVYQPPYPNAFPGIPVAHPQPPHTSPVTAAVGTIQPEHLKASILSAVEDKIKQRLREKLGKLHFLHRLK
ncbi:unnamed protein product [Toxocara canis]|uniref:UEV domain-containing protein n=1 Tax=Toxocara canis TaxID=6265 RepID=A0A183VER6_TOXCA|nr:unnamed protein product [Toxocara canis]